MLVQSGETKKHKKAAQKKQTKKTENVNELDDMDKILDAEMDGSDNFHKLGSDVKRKEFMFNKEKASEMDSMMNQLGEMDKETFADKGEERKPVNEANEMSKLIAAAQSGSPIPQETLSVSQKQ